MNQLLNGKTPEVDPGAFIAPGAFVIGDVTLHEGANIWHNAVLRGDMDKIVIGKNSNIQDGSVVHNTAGIPVVVGENVTVGHRAVLHSCSIGDNSLIGMGAIVLDGVVIGKNCLVGAGALVTPNTVVPEGSVVLGSPAKVVKEIKAEQIEANIRNAMEYCALAKVYQQVPGKDVRE